MWGEGVRGCGVVGGGVGVSVGSGCSSEWVWVYSTSQWKCWSRSELRCECPNEWRMWVLMRDEGVLPV